MKKPIKNRIKITLYASCIVLFVSIPLFYFFNQKSKIFLLEKKVTNRKRVIDSLYSANELQKNFLKADNYFIVGDYDSAALSYENMNHPYLNDSLNQVIDSRIERVTSVNASHDSIAQHLILFRHLNNNARHEISTLLSEIETLQRYHSFTLFNQENKIRQLQQKVDEKDNVIASLKEKKLLSFVNLNEVSIYYLGEVDNELANGIGVGVFETGGIYNGQWMNNMRHGLGSYSWSNGHRYEGEFKNDLREGEGEYIWPNGEKYIGQWKDGKRNGEGILYDEKGKIIYEGLWKEDKTVNMNRKIN